MYFKDRFEAGLKLAKLLAKHKDKAVVAITHNYYRKFR